MRYKIRHSWNMIDWNVTQICSQVCNIFENHTKNRVKDHTQMGSTRLERLAKTTCFSLVVAEGVKMEALSTQTQLKTSMLCLILSTIFHSLSLSLSQLDWSECSQDGSRIVALRLPGVGFTGQIPPNTKILSLRSNVITGHFPSDYF
ncbi:hypothetical protein Ddye_007567 [Dipteronia dyeriana]|uniref:Uncharacterized protein n=1 Tax=Dipteronia dyeriana TaxID=168575 RepID=A0AAD9XK69_9ROSI|nr:hypothetical protein Ddye_007567 [Dipteronia dyeriana]